MRLIDAVLQSNCERKNGRKTSGYACLVVMG